jgi:hypothetical protein
VTKVIFLLATLGWCNMYLESLDSLWGSQGSKTSVGLWCVWKQANMQSWLKHKSSRIGQASLSPCAFIECLLYARHEGRLRGSIVTTFFRPMLFKVHLPISNVGIKSILSKLPRKAKCKSNQYLNKILHDSCIRVWDYRLTCTLSCNIGIGMLLETQRRKVFQELF